MELRNPPPNSFLQNAEWQELHVHAVHWQSDMSFFADELRFLNILFDKYFAAFIDEENMEKTKSVASRVSHVQSEHQKLTGHINGHLRNIEDLIKETSAENASALRAVHTSLQEDIAAFFKAFKEFAFSNLGKM